MRRSVKSERCRSPRTKLEKQVDEFKRVTASLISLPRVAEWACGRESGAFRFRGEAPDARKADWAIGRQDAGADTRVAKREGALPEHQRCQCAVQNVSKI